MSLYTLSSGRYILPTSSMYKRLWRQTFNISSLSTSQDILIIFNMKVFIVCTLVALTLAEPPSYRQQFQRDRTYYFAKQQEAAPEAADAPYPASGWHPEGPPFEYPQKQEQSAAPQQQYGAPQQQYGAPQQQYGAPQQQYGAPAQSQRQYVAPQAQRPAAPQNQYGTPAVSNNQYGTPSEPERQYGTPQGSYNAPARTQQQFSDRQNNAVSQQQYGAPQQQYGTPEHSTESSTTGEYEDQTTYPTPNESQAEPVDSVNELDEEGNVDEQQRQTGQYYIALPDGRLQRVQYASRQDLEAMKYFARIRAENVEPLRGPIYAYQPLQKLQFAPAQLEVAAEPVVPISSFSVNQNRNQKSNPSAPAKLEVQPVAAEVAVSPAVTSYTGIAANYQTPEQRYFITF